MTGHGGVVSSGVATEPGTRRRAQAAALAAGPGHDGPTIVYVSPLEILCTGLLAPTFLPRGP